MQIIPAIDLIDGKCVRLTQGDYQQKKIYHENPLEVAKWFVDQGVRKLHLVDLDGAKAKRVVNHKVLETISKNTDLEIEFGGGIKTDEDLQNVFDCGASQAIIGTVAVKNPDLFFKWLADYGADKIIFGADVKNEMLAVNGWIETSQISIYDFLKRYQLKGIKNVICTDISKDGMLQGPALGLYEKLIRDFPEMEIIASGGVANMEDIEALKKIGCPAVIVGKAIYEGNIHLNQYFKKNQ